MVLHIFMRFPNTYDQVPFHMPKFRVGLFLHFLDGIVALNGNPYNVPKIFPELLSQGIGHDSRFIIYRVEFHAPAFHRMDGFRLVCTVFSGIMPNFYGFFKRDMGIYKRLSG